jgi:hypothetical protein
MSFKNHVDQWEIVVSFCAQLEWYHSPVCSFCRDLTWNYDRTKHLNIEHNNVKV